MRRLSIFLALLSISAFADEKAKPNTLTPKEIADGWILLFDGESKFGWKVEGDATVKDGLIDAGGEKETTLSWLTFSGEGELRFSFSDDGKRWGQYRIELAPKAPKSTRSDGVPMDFYLRGNPPTIVVPPGKKAKFRDVCLRLGRMTSLFNGKDLTGWKEFKPTKDKKIASKYSVTKEGWLNVKDGPGDLQTEGQWANFIVQLECISNGKHLNSGLFFRCIPDLYQQGYEAQIRNEWMGDDRTKPVDFGTGAIYRRQPARKVVSTDGEWFTMTVAAHGRHIATWVNGYQVADWTDDRKEADNARNGFKSGKGALSIQGHDPTTDLSFRNIRIQSLDN
jgi:hypothetical protein